MKIWKGKEYNDNNEIIFDGFYLNGNRWNGQGKEYDKYNNLIYEGKYLNCKKWNGKIYEIKNNTTYQLENENGYIKELIKSKINV